MNLSILLRRDFFYQTEKGEYVLGQNNEFIETDMNKFVDDLQPYLEGLFLKLCKKTKFLAQYDLNIDFYALWQVMYKFTRDIFGPRRLLEVLKKVAANKNIRGYMKDFGLKMNSEDPNMHRRVAYFFYWFSVYKPFHLSKGEGAPEIEIPEKKKYIIDNFNEVMTYGLVQMALSSCIIDIPICTMPQCKNKIAGLEKGDCFLTISLNQNEYIFERFLARLHSNKLNRSSLELLLSNSYICSRCKKNEGPCLLQKDGFLKWRTF